MKPILITHPDAPARLAEWLLAHGWEEEKNISGVCYRKNGAEFTELSFNNHLSTTTETALFISRIEGVTPDSLFYQLQIICPLDQIEYQPEWIEKILSGEKTMSIRKTQYPCGYYWLVTPDGEKHGVIEIFNVRTYPMSIVLDTCERVLTTNENPSFLVIDALETAEKSGFGSYDNVGFDVVKKFIAYHRHNYSAIKYAHTFTLVDLEL